MLLTLQLVVYFRKADFFVILAIFCVSLSMQFALLEGSSVDDDLENLKKELAGSSKVCLTQLTSLWEKRHCKTFLSKIITVRIRCLSTSKNNSYPGIHSEDDNHITRTRNYAVCIILDCNNFCIQDRVSTVGGGEKIVDGFKAYFVNVFVVKFVQLLLPLSSLRTLISLILCNRKENFHQEEQLSPAQTIHSEILT